jgi:hypothetical protein
MTAPPRREIPRLADDYESVPDLDVLAAGIGRALAELG